MTEKEFIDEITQNMSENLDSWEEMPSFIKGIDRYRHEETGVSVEFYFYEDNRVSYGCVYDSNNGFLTYLPRKNAAKIIETRHEKTTDRTATITKKRFRNFLRTFSGF